MCFIGVCVVFLVWMVMDGLVNRLVIGLLWDFFVEEEMEWDRKL